MNNVENFEDFLGRMQGLLDDAKKKGHIIVRVEDLENAFPELKESEDELTWLTNYISDEAYSLSMDIRDYEDSIKLKKLRKALAWLEKQGKQEPKDKYTFNSTPRLLDMIEPTNKAKVYCHKLIDTLVKEGYTTDAKIVSDCLKQMNGKKVAMATMDEQKPIERKDFISIPFGAYDSELVSETITIPDGYVAIIEDNKIHIKREGKSAIEAIKEEKIDNVNKVEPKFKVGDWVINKFGDSWHIDSFDKKNYQVSDGKGNHNYFPISKQEEMRLWTIEDAKDGDVICYKDEISLYKHDIKNCTKQETTFGGFVYHCCYDGKRFITDSFYFLTKQDKIDVYPATKEQRDLLFQKMKEADYEWDSENKKPIKKK